MTGKRAGESAAEVARRTREKIERLQRSAAAWEAGAAGEQMTGAVLDGLDPSAWRVWHDVRWPGRQRANLDHVVVGPPGVFVIDSKNWSGDVQLIDGVLRQGGRPRTKEVDGVAQAAQAVRMLGPEAPVYGVLCVVRPESLAGWSGEVMICSNGNLDVMVQTRPHVLMPDQVAATAAWLGAGFEAKPQPRPEPVGSRTTAEYPPVVASRRRLSFLRPLLGVAAVALIAGAVSTGAFTTGLQWVGDHVTNVVEEQAPVIREPERPKDASSKRKVRRKAEQERQKRSER